MQFEVIPMYLTEENDHKPDGSFKMAYPSYTKIHYKSKKAFPDMRFSRSVQWDSVVSYSTIKIYIIYWQISIKINWKSKNGLFDHRKTIIEWLINYAWPVTMAKCWETFSTIIICNIKSIGGPKVEKMAKTCFHE